MTAVHVPVDTPVSWIEAPTASRERFERFTAKEAEHFLARRFSIFVARGLDSTSALQRATRPEES